MTDEEVVFTEDAPATSPKDWEEVIAHRGIGTLKAGLAARQSKLEFDQQADAGYFEIAAAEVALSKEIEPGIVAYYDTGGHLVGIEVRSVSRRSRST